MIPYVCWTRLLSNLPTNTRDMLAGFIHIAMVCGQVMLVSPFRFTKETTATLSVSEDDGWFFNW